MKFSQIKELSGEELASKLESLEEELFNINFQSSLTKSPKTSNVKAIKKDIARIKTFSNQRV